MSVLKDMAGGMLTLISKRLLKFITLAVTGAPGVRPAHFIVISAVIGVVAHKF